MKMTAPVLALVLFAFALLLRFGVLGPLSGALDTAKADLVRDEAKFCEMRMTVMFSDRIAERISALESTGEVYRATWISPMLNSYAMRAKAFLDAAAVESGFVNVDYSEDATRLLPMPGTGVPANRTARRAVRLKASADYAAIVSFLMRVELEHPTIALQSILITPPKSTGVVSGEDLLDVEMTFEWPCAGEVVK